jgi:hypothetical protein
MFPTSTRRRDFSGDLRPLQVETMREMQGLTDRAYERAMRLYESGDLGGGLSKEQAVGRYVNNQVRRELRKRYKNYQVKMGTNEVRVNRREYDN